MLPPHPCDWLWALCTSMALLPSLHLEYEGCWPYATSYKNGFSPLLFGLLVPNSESGAIYLIGLDSENRCWERVYRRFLFCEDSQNGEVKMMGTPQALDKKVCVFELLLIQNYFEIPLFIGKICTFKDTKSLI